MSSSDSSRGPTGDPVGDRDDGDWYEIRVQGRLDDRWAAWFDGLDLSRTDHGTTVLRGRVTDQAALHGLLHKLRDLGVPLLSVTRTEPGPGA
jgi:hypothetical protein